MKFCPICNQTYADETLNFCLIDGVGLKSLDGATPTAQMSAAQFSYADQVPMTTAAPKRSSVFKWLLLAVGGLGLLLVGVLIGGKSLIHERVADQLADASNRRDPVNAAVKTAEPDDETPVITLAKFNKIKNGMSYAEVVQILGSEGEVVYKNEYGKYRNASYKWQANYFSFVLITFQNEKVVVKVQSALGE